MNVLMSRPYGLSPRVRGNQLIETRSIDRLGSIPACAGEPWAPAWPRRPRWVYPRVCGGTVITAQTDMLDYGLSPRVRGNHDISTAQALGVRSIPACAGEPG